MKLKNLPKIDLPREKLEKYGPEKLKDSELLAILLGAGVKGTNVIELSCKILLKWKDKGLGAATMAELSEVHGIGKAKACEIVACFELGKRLLKDKKVSVVLSPSDVWSRMEDVRNSKREHFVVFYLDSRNQEVKREVVSIGTLNASLVHPREVFESAIKNNAASIIVAHNHPSGDLEPSMDDIEITKKLVHAGKILGISLIDHVVVSGSGHKSIINNI